MHQSDDGIYCIRIRRWAWEESNGWRVTGNGYFQNQNNISFAITATSLKFFVKNYDSICSSLLVTRYSLPGTTSLLQERS